MDCWCCKQLCGSTHRVVLNITQLKFPSSCTHTLAHISCEMYDYSGSRTLDTSRYRVTRHKHGLSSVQKANIKDVFHPERELHRGPRECQDEFPFWRLSCQLLNDLSVLTIAFRYRPERLLPCTTHRRKDHSRMLRATARSSLEECDVHKLENNFPRANSPSLRPKKL